MHIEHLIRKIVDEGDRSEMEKLSDILEEVIDLIKEYDEEAYSKYKMCLYKMAYGEVLSEDMADDIIRKMQPYGMKWTLNESEQIQRDFGLEDIRPVDFWIVMNSAFNDFRNVFGDNLDTYVRYTQAFINDEDAKQGKIFLYFTQIPKRKGELL